MAKKVNMVAKAAAETVQPIEEAVAKKEVKHYDNAHLVMFCGACNSRYILEENITKDKGVTINLPPTSDAEIILVCKECGNKMGLFYVEAATKDVPEIDKSNENESISEGNTESK